MVNSFIQTVKTLPKDFWMVCIATTLFYSATHTFTTMLPIYLTHMQFGADVSGQLLAFFLITSVITRPWVGKFYEEHNPKYLFAIGLACFMLGNIVMLLFPTQLWVLWLGRLFQGLGFSVFNGSSYSFLTQTVPDHARARGISIFSNSIKMAMAYAPAIGWLLADRGLYLQSMGTSLIFALGSLALLWQVAFEKYVPQLEQKKDAPKVKGKLFNKKGVFPGLLIATNSIVFGALIPFVPLIVASKGLSNVEGFHLCYAISLIASRFIGGDASDRYGRVATIIPGMAIVAIALSWMAVADSTVAFLGATILYGLGGGVVQPSIVAMVADRTEKAERGSAMATYTMLADFGQASGMVLMGLFGEHFSYTSGIFTIVAINFSGLVLASTIPIKAYLKQVKAQA